MRPGSVIRLIPIAGLVAALTMGGCDVSVAPTPGSGSASPPPAVVSPRASAIPRPIPTPTPRPTPTAGPAAEPAVGLVPPCPGSTPAGHPVGRLAVERSSNWSGYVATLAGSRFTCVEATWIQPTVECHGLGDQAVTYWVGLGGYDQHALVQIGTESTCLDGQPHASAWRESLPQQRHSMRLGLDIRVGHRIRAQVRWLGGSEYRLTLVDLTNRQRFTIEDTNTVVRRSSAEWIVEAPNGGCPKSCRILKMPDFGTLTFVDARMTYAGRRLPFDAAGPVHLRETMQTQAGKLRSQVTSTAPSGTWFKVRWRRS